MTRTPQIVAHRGASHFCRENTMAAFTRALSDGAATVECDLRLTADRQLVVHHDADCMLAGEKLRIADLNLADLQKVAHAIPPSVFLGRIIPQELVFRPFS